MDFAQSMDCPAQSSNRYFVQKSTDCGVVAQTMGHYWPLLVLVVYSKMAVV